MIAPCGLDCETCPVFKATLSGDAAKRRKVAEQWTRAFGWKLTEDDIHCDGCLSVSGKRFFHCENCKPRQCSQEKGLPHCGPCPDAPCPDLATLFKFSPSIQKSFEKLRAEQANG